jgi:hypothetical protein
MLFPRLRRASYASLILAAASTPLAAQEVNLPLPQSLSTETKAKVCAKYDEWKKEDSQLSVFQALGSFKLSRLREEATDLYPGVKETLTNVAADAWKNWNQIQAEGRNKNKDGKEETMLDYMVRQGVRVRVPAWEHIKALCS